MPDWGRGGDITVVRLGDSATHQVVLFLRDVTRRKQYEDELGQREQRYRTLFNAIEEGFGIIELVVDEHGQAQDYRVLKVNRAAERITRLKDVIGRTLCGVVARPTLDWFSRYGELARTGEPQQWTDYSAALLEPDTTSLRYVSARPSAGSSLQKRLSSELDRCDKQPRTRWHALITPNCQMLLYTSEQ